LTAGAIRSA
jgi:Pyrimidine reductase, riboflavin biosynthesis